MPLSIDEFVAHLAAAKLLSVDETSSLLSSLPEGDRPAQAESLAALLVRQAKLTPFQSQRLLAGKSESLALGNYVLLDKLGHGGMGDVYKAQHRRMKRIVAVKVVKPELVESPDSLKRFQREVETVAKLDHPNIVTAHDADESQGVHFLVLQFVEGRDLATAVRQGGPLPVGSAAGCILQAARALAYAHGQGIIHRDIKPSNMLLDRQGTVKVLDLGLATLLGRDARGNESLTHSETIVGSLDYMAPEQARSSKHADERSDIYSLGISLWYLLVGRPPYGGENVVERILAHREEPIPHLTAERPEVPAELDAIFRRMVAKLPADRFQSMVEVVQALEAFLASQPPSSVTEVTSQWTRPNALSGIAPASTPSSGQETTELRTQDATPVDQPSLAKAQEMAGGGWRVPAVVVALILLLGGVALAMMFRSNPPLPNVIIQLQFDQPGAVGAVVSIDGVERVTVKSIDQPLSVELPPDEKTHVLQVACQGHEPYSRGFMLEAAEKEPLRIRLKPLAVAVNPPQPMPMQVPPSNPPAGSPPPVVATLPFDPHRRVAEMVIARGGSANISTGRRYLMGVKELPLEPFGVATIFLGEQRAVTDEDLKLLNDVPYLIQLNLSSTSITDEALSHLRHLDAMVGLTIRGTNVTDAGIVHVTPCRDLEWINLTQTKVADGTCREVLKLARLGHIDLGKTQITDDGLASLAKHECLKTIVLSGNPQLTADGIAKLQPLSTLQNLELGDTALGDEVVDVLLRFKQLRYIDLTGTQVSDAQALRLQAGLSSAAIKHPGVPVREEEKRATQWLLDQRAVVTAWYGAMLTTVPDSFFAVHSVRFGANPPAEGAENLLGLSAIELLEWSQLKEADRQAMNLARLDSLHTLKLTDSDLTREGLKHLAALKHLRHLGLIRYAAPDEQALEPLVEFPALRDLDLSLSSVDDRGLAPVARCARLRSILLNGCKQLTSDGLRSLTTLAELRSLSLVGTNVDDAAVPHLKQLSSLRTIDLSDTKVTAEGVAELKRSLPKCSFTWTGGVVIPGAIAWPAPAKAPFTAAQAKEHQAAWAKRFSVPVAHTSPSGIKLRLIPPGEFLMGSTAEQIEPLKASGPRTLLELEVPQHPVTVATPFWMSETEITIGQFRAFVEATSHVTDPEKAGGGLIPGTEPKDGLRDPKLLWTSPGYEVTEDSPVTLVGWFDAARYCNWLSDREKLPRAYDSSWKIVPAADGYRLPTEAEWEYACRAGTTTHYSFGDDASKLKDYGWHARGCAEPVGGKLPNAFGLFDMHGNAWEWCQDPLASYDPSAPPPTPGSYPAARGGSGYDSAVTCRSAIRSTWHPTYSHILTGFRVVRPIKPAATYP